MYCFYYLCHEEAAIIPFCVEVLHFGSGSVGWTVCVWGTMRFLSWFSFSDTLCWACFYHCCQHNVGGGAAENQNIWRETKRDWKANDRCHIWKHSSSDHHQKVETIHHPSLKGFSFTLFFSFLKRQTEALFGAWFSKNLNCFSLCLQQSGKTHMWFICCRL